MEPSHPTDPMLPQAGESALSLELGLVMAAIGLAIFFFVLWRLVRQSRRASSDRADPPADGPAPADQPTD